jgi:hypothetical protein
LFVGKTLVAGLKIDESRRRRVDLKKADKPRMTTTVHRCKHHKPELTNDTREKEGSQRETPVGGGIILSMLHDLMK